ncbi:PSD1 and planctomycete cytochrome C domain-containing protein [Lacipirellula limnantheis]|uniref:Planctomycete cytochrome C n=1 Tax=Lacipirellula limnantheis TaxID=2528024 RepID=A0A517U244_9BACT|nr:PSD1 and planctomycete cytochrome C domain-containing protein [Lacipirellula limnantheis]QDT74688.1 Planctomycete cytochrome C [Lacipirellula limnantheis]
MGTRVVTTIGRLAAGVAIAFSASISFAAQPALTEQMEFFEQRVRPLLVEHCYPCHAGNKRQGGLSLEYRSGWQTGGDRGPAILADRPEDSPLLRAVRYQDDYPQMPPDGKLSAEQIAVLEQWVRMGAPDPRDGEAIEAAPGPSGTLWVLEPLPDVTPPQVDNAEWPLGDIDRFVLARLEQKGWQPSPDVDRGAWLRRVTFDLTGLPPTMAEVDAFLGDASEEAFARVVDRLLSSREYGERWARPWLDLVGYADQIGSANNVPAEQAWRYRDYVIRALNAEKPFDQFIREQLAGDLLTSSSIEERQDQIIATGFLVLGNVNIVESDKLVMRMDLVDHQIEKVGKAFLGMSLQCARCHDHKFDPIILQDYYGLAGIFASTESTRKVDRGVWSTVTLVTLPETLAEFTTREAALSAHDREVEEIRQEQALSARRIDEIDRLLETAEQGISNGESATLANASSPEDDRSPAELKQERADLAAKVAACNQRLWHKDYIRPSAPATFAVKEGAEIGNSRICLRGNPHAPGDVVPRGFIRAMARGTGPKIPADQSGRQQLADWLTGPASHVVSRVTVNRLWQKLFGRGIVDSVDYFGARSEPPSHPELLDFLARQFISQGWSQKQLLRELVLSRTYRQQSTATTAASTMLAADPDNRLLWRMSPRRLEAEMIRDALLASSGLLRCSAGGPALAPEFMENVGELDPKSVNPISFSLQRFRDDAPRVRTIYLPVVRSSEQRGPADILNFFDFPQPAQYTGGRPTTAVASQALFLINGPLLQQAAKSLTETLLADSSLEDEEARLHALYRRVLNRPCTPEELSNARAFLGASAPAAPENGSAGADASRHDSWQQLAHALLASNEFLFRL